MSRRDKVASGAHPSSGYDYRRQVLPLAVKGLGAEIRPPTQVHDSELNTSWRYASTHRGHLSSGMTWHSSECAIWPRP
jgi:hypothetical protein